MEPRVVALAPMPPEKAAYALARYSRSPDGIEASLRWVFEHSAEKFWEQFYFDYGHSSIADLGHAVVCFENVSELAAIHIEDERVWDGQAKSSRYQDFGKLGYHVPQEVGDADVAAFRAAADGLFRAYRDLLPPVERLLRDHNPRPAEMKEAVYARNLAARAFDVVRYVLPLAVPTNVGQAVSIRTLEKQIGHLLAAPVRRGAAGRRAPQGRLRASRRSICGASSVARARNVIRWRRRSLATRAPTSTGRRPTTRSRASRPRSCGSVTPAPAPLVELAPEHPLEVEIAATLLYRVSSYPYRQIVETISDWSEAKREIGHRGGACRSWPRRAAAGAAVGYRPRLRRADGRRRLARHASAPPLPAGAPTLHVRPRVRGAGAARRSGRRCRVPSCHGRRRCRGRDASRRRPPRICCRSATACAVCSRWTTPRSSTCRACAPA